MPDSLTEWTEWYPRLAVSGVRSAEVEHKTALQLERFRAFQTAAYGWDRL